MRLVQVTAESKIYFHERITNTTSNGFNEPLNFVQRMITLRSETIKVYISFRICTTEFAAEKGCSVVLRTR